MAEGDFGPSSLIDPKEYSNIVGQWNNFLDRPGGRAALLSAGISLLQPPSFGDTGASQIGRAIGAAGETVGRQEAMDIKQQEADTKAMLREAQAQRAGAAAGEQAGRLELAREKLGVAREQMDAQARVKAALGYGAEIKGIRDRNARRTQQYQKDREIFPNAAPPVLEAEPTPEQYIEKNKSFYSPGPTGQRGVLGPVATPPAAAPTSGLAPRDQEALDWANQNPNDSRAAEIKRRLGM